MEPIDLNIIVFHRELGLQQSTLMSQRKNFNTMHELALAVEQHEDFQHEIKGKRIKKQLATLEDYHNEKITFKHFQISACGVSFYVQVQHQYRLFDYELLIDFEYPFNRPRVFYQNEGSPYAGCQDLLDNVLNGGVWGPSLLLNGILDKLPDLSRQLFEQSENLRTAYHLNELYQAELLEKYHVEMFNVEEYEWKYMIKSTSNRVLALTKDHFLKLTPEGNKLRLVFCVRIKDIKEANATINNGKFKLQITATPSEGGKLKLYFGGAESDIQRILYFMNPIQALERQLSKMGKKAFNAEELQEVIQKYSELIEYYSLRDQEKSKGYVNAIQELIRENYQNGMKEEQRPQPALRKEEDIKT